VGQKIGYEGGATVKFERDSSTTFEDNLAGWGGGAL
jgi:hypothetical protein